VRTLFPSLICICGLAACDTPRQIDQEGQIGHDIGEHRFGDTFTTPEGGKMEMVEEQIVVSFLEVLEDSRCPKTVTCVWQGVAKIKAGAIIHPDAAKGYEEFVLATYPESARTATIGDFRIELLDLSPYPDAAAPTATDGHTATLRVTRK